MSEVASGFFLNIVPSSDEDSIDQSKKKLRQPNKCLFWVSMFLSLFCGVLFGMGTTSVKYLTAVKHIDVLIITAVRQFVTMLCTLPMFVYHRRPQKTTPTTMNDDDEELVPCPSSSGVKRKSNVIKYAAVCFTGVLQAGVTLLAFIAFEKANASSATVLMHSFPIPTMLLAWTFFKEQPHAKEIASITLIVAGDLMVINPFEDSETFTTERLIGMMCALASGLLYGICLTIQRRLTGKQGTKAQSSSSVPIHYSKISFISSVSSWAFIVPLACLYLHFMVPDCSIPADFFPCSTLVRFLILFPVSSAGTLCLIVSQFAMKHISSTVFSLMLTIEIPVVFMIESTGLTPQTSPNYWYSYLGAVLAISGCVLPFINFTPRNKQASQYATSSSETTSERSEKL